MFSAILSLAAATLMALSAAGFGMALARRLSLKWESPLERATVTIGLGAGLLSFLTFWIGIARLMRRPIFLIVLVPSALLGIRWSSRTETPAATGRLSWPGVAALALLAVCVMFNVLGTLAPPSFIDALIYHLFAPQQFLKDGGLTELPAIWQLYQPFSVEMLFTAAYSLAGERTAALMTTGFGLLALGATALLGRQIAGATVGWIAAAIFYCTGMTAWESTSCFIDLGVTTLGSLGIYALLRWDNTGQRGWFVAAGLLLGFAAACKLNAAVFPILGLLVVAFFSHRRGEKAKTIIGRMTLLGVLCSAPVIPWYIRAWILTGNPIYPFGAAIFGDNPEWRAIRWIFQGYGVGYGLRNRLLAFWNLFSRGAAFENGHYFSPLPMLMMPVVFWRARTDRHRAVLLGCVVIFFAIWSTGAHVARYLIPIQPILCALAAEALCWLGSEAGARRTMAGVVGSLFLVFGTLSTVLYDRQFLPVVFGFEARSSYLQRMTWYYAVYGEVCAQLPPGGRVLTNVGPTYYLNCPHERAPDVVLSSPERLGELLATGKFTHVLILANKALEAQIARLSPNVRSLWQRQIDVNVSRSFGRWGTVPVALFEVTQPS